MKSNRILIVSASIGNGHMQAAAAICEGLRDSTSCNVEIVDFLQAGQFRYPKLNRLQIELMSLMKSSYYGILKVAPHVYKEIYKITEKQHTRKVIDFISAANQKTMAKLIASYRPHIVICTHPFPLGAACQLRRKKKREFTLVGVITDFAVHPWWLGGGVDHYFVANEIMAHDLQKHAISASQVTCAGIPVGKRFTQVSNKSRKQVPHILVMGGGLGFGRMETTLQKLEELPNLIEVTVVAGKNQEFEERARILAGNLKNKVTVLPFSPDIATIMKDADLLITKPGGLTCSEALAVNLPMILLNPLPGQEEENASYLHEQGSAFWIQDEREIPGKITSLLFEDQKWLQEMQVKCAAISPEFATARIAEKISLLADENRRNSLVASGCWQRVGGQSC